MGSEAMKPVSNFEYFVINVIINPLNAELNPICHLLVLLGPHLIIYLSRMRVNFLSHRRHIAYPLQRPKSECFLW